jgi:short-subunit dehydrogenase
MKSKRALVTGASSGIGHEFALQLADRGYAITAVARREDSLRELVEQLPGEGHDFIVADLSTAEGVELVGEALDEERLHLLVNNAGASVLEPFYRSPLAKQQGLLQLNCGAVVALAHWFLNQAEKGDALINLASVVAYLPTPSQPIYSASKAFVASFSECLWHEHRERGIYVMGLCPGLTHTGFIMEATKGESDGKNLPALMTQTSQEVVSEALAALDKRGNAIVITGRSNRLMGLLPRFLTRQRLIKVMGLADPEDVL